MWGNCYSSYHHDLVLILHQILLLGNKHIRFLPDERIDFKIELSCVSAKCEVTVTSAYQQLQRSLSSMLSNVFKYELYKTEV